jgi:hypothetical protein
MTGGSQSRLVMCDDSKLYVLKLHPNPQGPNVLANEALGAMLMKGLGLLTPQWRTLRLNLQSLSIFPELVMGSVNGMTLPACGLHFGSEYLGAPEIDLFDFLPASGRRQTENADQNRCRTYVRPMGKSPR